MEILARTTELDSADQDMHYLKDAREYLETPAESQLFPLKEPDSKCFLPDLPNDLILNFRQNERFWQCPSMLLAFTSKGFLFICRASYLVNSSILRLGTYQGKEVEIVDEMSIETLSPKLAEAYSSIEHAEALCRDTLTKLIIYNNVL
ncbi:hypothetical protein BASA81_015336 [Batrachochytrium salamandrivorans]|nr:hypothetical protein BASA81_015336 [Batrachochytrium salamandrivorans]